MLLDLIRHGVIYLSNNAEMVAMVIAAEEFLKKWLEQYKWFNGSIKIILAFILAAAFIIKVFPPEITGELLAEIIAVGGTAAGLFSAGQAIVGNPLRKIP